VQVLSKRGVGSVLFCGYLHFPEVQRGEGLSNWRAMPVR